MLFFEVPLVLTVLSDRILRVAEVLNEHLFNSIALNMIVFFSTPAKSNCNH